MELGFWGVALVSQQDNMLNMLYSVKGSTCQAVTFCRWLNPASPASWSSSSTVPKVFVVSTQFIEVRCSGRCFFSNITSAESKDMQNGNQRPSASAIDSRPSLETWWIGLDNPMPAHWEHPWMLRHEIVHPASWFYGFRVAITRIVQKYVEIIPLCPHCPMASLPSCLSISPLPGSKTEPRLLNNPCHFPI